MRDLWCSGPSSRLESATILFRLEDRVLVRPGAQNGTSDNTDWSCTPCSLLVTCACRWCTGGGVQAGYTPGRVLGAQTGRITTFAQKSRITTFADLSGIATFAGLSGIATFTESPLSRRLSTLRSARLQMARESHFAPDMSRGVSEVSQRCPKGVLKVSQGCPKGVPRVSQGCPRVS